MFGISLPKISLPKLDLGKIGKAALSKGVEILKGVAKDAFTPAKDGKHIFNTDLNVKVGPFDIKLKNPIEVLAEKLLGKAGDFLKGKGLDPSVIGGLLGGGARPVAGAGTVDMPALPERLEALSTVDSGDGVEGVGGGGDIEGAGDVGGVGGSVEAPGTPASAASLGGSDFGEKAINKFGGTISSLDSQIDGMMNKGGDLSAGDQIKLQRSMQKRNEMFQLLTQIMQMEHETKKQIIGNIR